MIGRLHGRAHFAALRGRGSTVRGKRLSVRFGTLAGDDQVRVGYAITKKVGGAVQRNRLRRQLRAVVAEIAREDDERLMKGAYLIRAEPSAAGSSYASLRAEVEVLLDRLSSGARR